MIVNGEEFLLHKLRELCMIVNGLQFCFHRVKTFAAVTPVLHFLLLRWVHVYWLRTQLHPYGNSVVCSLLDCAVCRTGGIKTIHTK